MDASQVPAYSSSLRAYHEAFGPELNQVINALPLENGSAVLDVPCGGGFYAAALARRLYPPGKVIGVDRSGACLDQAQHVIGKLGPSIPVEFVKANAYRLPFPDETFDLVWCARSLISLKDPVAALREMKRVLKNKGVVAVLEDDAFHRIVINGPVNLEVDLHRAIAEASREKFGSRAAMSPSRRVLRFLMDAGLRLQKRRTFAADRQAPFDTAVKKYLKIYLMETRKFVEKHLSAENLKALDRLIDPHNKRSFFRRPDAELTCLATLFLARKMRKA